MNITDPEFIPGQRWLSDADAELGLGTVLRTDGRCVHMKFPACGETRMYALPQAPLTRVRFTPGDTVEDKQGGKFKVLRVEEQQGLLSYLVQQGGEDPRSLPESSLSDHFHQNHPREKLFAARLDADVWFSLRYQSWLAHSRQGRSQVHGLQGARVVLIPHQLYIASEITARFAPRVLLADEVGLGKTIEAGLIIHRMLATQRARRVLIVVPGPLLHQWLVEMLRRFNLRFSLFDEERFTAIDAANPFLEEQRVLCSLEFLVSRPEIAQAALEGEWDLLVVDEAHHLQWSETASSLEYDLVEALASQILAVLLLTATPEQLGRAGHFGRLRLLDPHRYHDYPAFLQQEQQYQPVAEIASRLLDGDALDTSEQELLSDLLGEAANGDREQVINSLLDRHGTGRVLFRNTRSAIKGFPARKLFSYPLPMPDSYAVLKAEPEELLTPELLYAGDWTGVDPRVDWLAHLLGELQPEKVLVICAHAQTVVSLRDVLLKRKAIHAAVFHEHMQIVERDRAAAFFANPEDGTQLLLCSEIGSEGRNFQFSHHLVLFDLPLEPELLEQRIGRLDRIGQTETIQIHVPYIEGSAGEVIYHWYHRGLNTFESISTTGGEVYRRYREQLLSALVNFSELDRLIPGAAETSAQLNARVEAGRDRLLELHSHNPELSVALLQMLQAEDKADPLADYMMRYWDAFGVEHEPGPGVSHILHTGAHMLQEYFPGLGEDGATVTFDRTDALAHEDREFLTWEHPMVAGAMDMLVSGDLGSTALSLVKRDGVQAGTLMLEAIFIAECLAPAELQARQFLPPSCIRLLLDSDGRNYSQELPHDSLQGECFARDRQAATAAIKSQLGKLRPLLEQAEAVAQRVTDAIVVRSVDKMQSTLELELERMHELARVNPAIRKEEIQYLEHRLQQLARFLQDTRLRVDALRLIVFH